MPLVRNGTTIGVFALQRDQVSPFNEKQIQLVTTFADQAVIAIENARLLNELRESLEQQTATSDVLRVISSSPTDIQPVLEIIGERAERLCEAEISVVSIVDGELIRVASIHGMTEAGVEAARRAFPMRRADETIMARAVRTRSVCHVADVLSDPEYQQNDNAGLAGLRHVRMIERQRGCLGVPMVRDDQVIGAIFVARRQPGLFSDAQVQLLKTFADQAVIAIDNVRLFNETKISLEQQTATADVLKTISRSTFDLPTVLNTLVESAARLCKADKAQILVPSEDAHRFYSAASYGHTAEYNEHLRNISFAPELEGVVGRVQLERKPVQIPDVLADPDYRLREVQRLGGFRSHLGLPLLREADLIGILLVSRDTVQPFEDQHIELLTTFADQAVIAIENTRLFEAEQQRSRELAESLNQQTATSEVLQVISRSAFDLEAVLNTLVESAILSNIHFGLVGIARRRVPRSNAERSIFPMSTPTQSCHVYARRTGV